MTKFKVITYKDSTKVKSKDRRVSVFTLPDQEIGIQLKIVADKNALKPRAYHKVDKDKVVTTSLKISVEGAYSLMLALQQELEKIINI